MSNFTDFDGKVVQADIDQRQTPARRATDTNMEIIAHKTSRLASEFSEFKADINKAIDRIESAMRYNHATLSEAMDRTSAESARAIASAVPEGDIEGHRRHHEALIKKAEESAEFWAKMKLEITKYGLFGFLGWAAYALWQAFLLGPKK